MKRPSLHPDELAMQLDDMLPADRALFDAAVAAVAERQALGWRFRLVMIESVMMAGLVLIDGLLVARLCGSFGRASCWERGCPYVYISCVAVTLNQIKSII